GNVDRFLAFWIEILTEGRQSRIQVAGPRVRKAIQRFLRDADVAAARAASGDEAVLAELEDAATLYFATCLTDQQYTSTLFRSKRLEPSQVEAKAATDAASALGGLGDSGALDDFTSRLPAALARGFLAALPAGGDEALRAAIARNRSAMLIEPLIWDR